MEWKIWGSIANGCCTGIWNGYSENKGPIDRSETGVTATVQKRKSRSRGRKKENLNKQQVKSKPICYHSQQRIFGIFAVFTSDTKRRERRVLHTKTRGKKVFRHKSLRLCRGEEKHGKDTERTVSFPLHLFVNCLCVLLLDS